MVEMKDVGIVEYANEKTGEVNSALPVVVVKVEHKFDYQGRFTPRKDAEINSDRILHRKNQ